MPLALSSAPRRRTAAVVMAAAVALSAGGCSGLGLGAEPSPSPAETAAPDPTEETSAADELPAARDVDWRQVAAEVEPSVVSIAVAGAQGSGEGSGVVIDDAGHVLTNHHVVAPAVSGGRMQVSTGDARVVEAELVGTDPATDLAVIRMADLPEAVAPIEVGDSEQVVVGQPVMALGNPLGLSHTVTVGIVSALDRPVTTENSDTSFPGSSIPVVTNAIQTDAAVNPGNSGGALVDGQGRLIGINSSIATLGASSGAQGGSIGLGFAIPVNQAAWIAEELISSGSVDHAYLGVEPQNAVVEADGVRREAAGVARVFSGTPAADAGLEAGDAVIEVDGETIGGALSLVAQIREREPGTQVMLTVVDRAGESRQVTVEFGSRPDE